AYKILKGRVETGRIGHACLLLFEDEKYLREALRFFAVALYHGDERASDLIERECFTDCLFYPAEGQKLSVADAEAIREEALIRPIEGDTKLFVAEIGSASPAAQNKLLKVLEEPPQGVRFLLGATSRYPVLPTVLSRVEQLEIPRFSETALSAYLRRRYGGTEDERTEAAVIGEGLPSRAEEFFAGGDYRSYLSLAIEAADASMGEIPSLARRIGALGDKRAFLPVLKLIYRDALLSTLGQRPLLSKGMNGSGHTKKSLVAAVELISEAERQIAFNANYPQAIEILLVRINKEKET
ncbi:MAG: hypothetical protein ACI4U2_05675, partial [Christensenellaceae bacterium]